MQCGKEKQKLCRTDNKKRDNKTDSQTLYQRYVNGGINMKKTVCNFFGMILALLTGTLYAATILMRAAKLFVIEKGSPKAVETVFPMQEVQ